MSAATRSTLRRLLSACFFALALAFLLFAVTARAQVYIPDPCATAEPGSFAWYFHFCWLDAFVREALDLLMSGVARGAVIVQ